jgi:hypothetical protein
VGVQPYEPDSKRPRTSGTFNDFILTILPEKLPEPLKGGLAEVIENAFGDSALLIYDEADFMKATMSELDVV